MDFAPRRLSLKLVWIAVGLLAVALAAIGYTLLQAWKLEGGAAVINDMGSERMRSYASSYSRSFSRASFDVPTLRLYSGE